MSFSLLKTFNLSPKIRAVSLVIIISLLACLLLFPLFTVDGWPRSHEDLRYIILFEHFKATFEAGIYYPRWLPDLYGGYGYPTFVFYQPAFFYSILPFSWISHNPMVYMTLTLLALCLFSAIGCYLLCRQFSDRLSSILGVFFFFMTPYLYVNLYVRGDLSELMAMLLTPWPLYLLHAVYKKISSNQKITIINIVILACSIAIIVMSHPAVALFFVPLLCLIGFFLGFKLPIIQRYKLWLNIIISMVLAVIASAPYWLVLFQLRDITAIHSTTQAYFEGKNHVVFFNQLFDRTWGQGVSVLGPEDGMSFQLGLFHFIGAVIGFICNRKNRFIQITFALYLLTIIMMLPISASIWKLPLLNFVQFPWRILAVNAILQAVCAAGLLRRITNHKLIQLGLMATIAATMLAWHQDQFNAPNIMKGVTESNISRLINKQNMQFTTHAVLNEMLPNSVIEQPITPRYPKQLVEVSNDAQAIALPDNNNHNIQYQISSEQPFTLTINQLYFPGWIVTINGVVIAQTVLEASLNKHGLVNLAIDSGNYNVHASYQGPPNGSLRNLISILMIIVLLGLACRLNKKNQ